MLDIIINILINAAIVLGAAYLLPKVEVRSFSAALVTAILVGIIGWLIGWLLRGALNVATLGIPAVLGLGFIIRILASAVIFKIADVFIPGFKIHGFVNAIILAVIVAVIHTLIGYVIANGDDDMTTYLMIPRSLGLV